MWRRNMHVIRKIALSCIVCAALAAGLSSGIAAGPGFRDCKSCPEMVPLPKGEFVMGSPVTEKYRFDNEGPQHRVRVTRSIAIGKYPVTEEELAAWRPTKIPAGEARFPAVRLTWFDAKAYVQWLSQKTGHGYRLPTEAEYEYAERAGSTTPYYWGRTIGKGNANCIGCGSIMDGTGSTSVGSFPPNRFGLFDMAGNVFEWVEDCYFESQDGAPSEAHIARENANGTCPMRTLRASSWFNLPSFLRAAYRFREVPDGKNTRRGFRVVREMNSEP
jgi:formylglycine-generating enzyme required for sulfatase activity